MPANEAMTGAQRIATMRAKRKAEGQCIGCGERLRKKDLEYVRCEGCREVQAYAASERYHKYQADLQAKVNKAAWHHDQRQEGFTEREIAFGDILDETPVGTREHEEAWAEIKLLMRARRGPLDDLSDPPQNRGLARMAYIYMPFPTDPPQNRGLALPAPRDDVEYDGTVTLQDDRPVLIMVAQVG